MNVKSGFQLGQHYAPLTCARLSVNTKPDDCGKLLVLLRYKVKSLQLPSRRAVTEEGPNGSLISWDATDRWDPGPVARGAAQQRHRTLTDQEGRNKRESHSRVRTSTSNDKGGPWDAWRLYIVTGVWVMRIG